MSLLTASLAIVFFFGFAVAEISAPSCSSTWEWVCILTSLQCALWFLLGLMDLSSSHSILLAKIHARLQRTCCQHAMGVVSRFFVCFALHWRLISTLLFSVHPRAAAAGIQLRWPRRDSRLQLVRVQYRRIFAHKCLCRMPGRRVDHVRLLSLFSSQLPGFMCFPSAGRNSRTTVQ